MLFLSDNVNAQLIDFPPNYYDTMAYNGSRSSEATFSSYLTLISDDTNWIFQGGSSNNGVDGIPPDVPFDATSFTLSSPSAAPEPSSIVLATSGVLVIAAARRRRRSKV